MRAKAFSFTGWTDDGFIEIKVDEEMLKKVVSILEDEITASVKDKNYDIAKDYMYDRESLVDKLEALEE